MPLPQSARPETRPRLRARNSRGKGPDHTRSSSPCPLTTRPLAARKKQQQADRIKLGSAWADTGLVFSTRTGRPIEPRDLVRSFVRIRDSYGIRKIRLHAIRHTTASLLKDLGVPARDAQIILGHAHISTTQQIYTHVDEAARREALTRLNKLLGAPNEPLLWSTLVVSRQFQDLPRIVFPRWS
jgi:integrase